MQGGFTLLETIVAISVLVLATVGPLTLASSSIRSASLARNQTAAYFLAEEALEYINNRVTSNSFSGANWLQGLDPLCSNPTCKIDVPANQISGCGGACALLKIGSDGLYGYGSGEETIFRRTVILDEIENEREAKVQVIVEWEQLGGIRQAAVEDHLFNWR